MFSRESTLNKENRKKTQFLFILTINARVPDIEQKRDDIHKELLFEKGKRRGIIPALIRTTNLETLWDWYSNLLYLNLFQTPFQGQASCDWLAV